MWGALAALYEKQSLQVEAIKCYQRVLGCTDNDIESSTAAIIKLARLYETLNRDKAANYFEMVLQQKAREVAVRRVLGFGRMRNSDFKRVFRFGLRRLNIDATILTTNLGDRFG